jgi:hypothetical protein
MTETLTSEASGATRFPHISNRVPDELKEAEQWVLCDEHKVPLIATRSGACYAASSTDASTWRDYETAYEAWLANEWSFAGIGRVITEDEPHVGVDIDDVLDPETGEIEPWASRLLERLKSYTEISPSGRGVKIWTKAPEITRSYKKPGLEIYAKSRYFTVTGNVLGRKRQIAERSDELVRIIAEEFPRIDRDRRPYDGPKKVLDLENYLERAGIEIFTEMSDGTAERKYAVLCPWADEHTTNPYGGTVTGQYADGATFFYCYHAHCAGREWQEFKAYCDAVIYGIRVRKFKGRLR